jgi:hypothetical protein
VSWRWGGTKVMLHVFPVLGLTFPSADRPGGLRWRLWLTILAGPVVTLAIVLGNAPSWGTVAQSGGVPGTALH